MAFDRRLNRDRTGDRATGLIPPAKPIFDSLMQRLIHATRSGHRHGRPSSSPAIPPGGRADALNCGLQQIAGKRDVSEWVRRGLRIIRQTMWHVPWLGRPPNLPRHSIRRRSRRSRSSGGSQISSPSKFGAIHSHTAGHRCSRRRYTCRRACHCSTCSRPNKSNVAARVVEPDAEVPIAVVAAELDSEQHVVREVVSAQRIL